MKKLIVLVSALLLVSMVAIAQSDVTFSGEVEQRWLNDFNNKEYQQGPVVEIKLNAVVDDTASIYIEIEEGGSGLGIDTSVEGTVTDTGTGIPEDITSTGSQRILDKAYFDIDLGAIFMLPVGVTLRTGFDEYDQFDAAKDTVGEYEDVIGTDTSTWGHELNVMINEMITVRAILANDPGDEYYSFGAAVTYDPLYVEVSYVNLGNDFGTPEDPGKGDIEVGTEFIMEVVDGILLDLVVDLDYDLEEELTGDPEWMIGAGLAVTYNDLVTLGLAFRGMTDSEANSMQVDVSATPIEGVTVFLIAGLGLDSDIYDDAFESFEGSVMFMLGPSTWYAGLLWSAESAVNVIASEKADFVTEKADMLGVFMRAELKY
jgi:hypothetical protein